MHTHTHVYTQTSYTQICTTYMHVYYGQTDRQTYTDTYIDI